MRIRYLVSTGVAAVILMAGIAMVLAIPEEVSAYTVRGAINIDGNADFTSANGVVDGTGTSLDPFVIEGWEITGEYIAVTISNTDAHFMIRDLSLEVGTGGIYFYWVSHGTIKNSIMTDFGHAGIAAWDSVDIRVEGCNSSDNGHEGIIFRDSTDLVIVNNSVYHNAWQGIMLERCDNSYVVENTLLDNVYEDDTAGYDYQAGVVLFSCTGANIYGNNFLEDSGQHAYDDAESANAWNRGYPLGGNFWSDYSGLDQFRGLDQDETGSDGIGDDPYEFELYGIDRYPLMTELAIQAPSVILTQPADGMIVGVSVIAVAGTATPGSLVHVNGLTAFVSPDGGFELHIAIPEGASEIEATALLNGFTAVDRVNVTYINPVHGLEEELDDTLEELAEVQDELSTFQDDLDAVEDELDATKDDLNATQIDLGATDEELRSTSDDLDDVKSQNLVLMAVLAVFAILAVVMSVRFFSLRKKIVGMSKKLEEQEIQSPPQD